jgi:hypothetical protein
MMNDALTQTQIDKLEDALALLAAGVLLEEVLVQAGRDADWLRPVLALAGEVEALGQAIAVPPPQASLQRLLAHGNALRREERLAPRPAKPRSNVFQPLRQRLFRGGLSAATLAALVAVACLLGGAAGGGLVLAAEDSLPGQALYPVKRLGETLRLTLAEDESDRQRLEDRLGTVRRQEVEALLERNWAAEVVLTGRVESFSSTTLVVDQLVGQLTPETNITGELGIGAQVRIEGYTNPAGQLIARTVTVLEPPPAPPPTPTPTPQPPTATPVPTFKATSDTLKIESTPAPLVQPTATGTETDDDPGRDQDRPDNSGSGSQNSGPGNDSDQNEDNSGSGSQNSGSNNNVDPGDDESEEQPAGDNQNDNQPAETPEPSQDYPASNDNADSGSDGSGSSDDSNSSGDNSSSGSNSGRDDSDQGGNSGGSNDDKDNDKSGKSGGDGDDN